MDAPPTDATEWVRTAADERFVAEGGWFDLAAAERVRIFFRRFLRHSKGEWAGHPVLRWMAGNVAIEKDAADNWKPSKKRSRERIDGIVALVMAIDRATTMPPEPECWYRPGELAV